MRGRMIASAMSVITMVNSRRLDKGSNSPRMSSPCSSKAKAWLIRRAMVSASGVGMTPPGQRTKIRSPKCARRSRNAWLTVGCETPSSSAARETLRLLPDGPENAQAVQVQQLLIHSPNSTD